MTSTLNTTTKPYQAKTQEFDWINNTDPLERISHLSDLGENWDGYKAPRFSEAHQLRARKVLGYLDVEKFASKEKPFVAPCSDGSILFEWSGKRFPNKQLEIYISAGENDPLVYLKSSDDFEEEGTINLDNKQFQGLISWLFS